MVESCCAINWSTSVWYYSLFFATTKLGPSKASSFIFIVPITAPIFSMLFIGEKLGISTIIGGIMTMTAVYLINKEKIQAEPID